MKTRPYHIVFIAIFLILAALFISTLFTPARQEFQEQPDVLLKIDEVEGNFGTLENYARSDETEGIQSLRFKIEKDDRELDLGTQIIKKATQEDTPLRS